MIIDEIGRGTSTFDGLSIAWSVAEYICKSLNSRTLFSTHYHELTRLSETYEKIKNYRVLVQEDKGNIIFLYKLLEGSSDRSYGIQVARLAGLPQDIINRANNILGNLEKSNNSEDKGLNNGLMETEAALTSSNTEQFRFGDLVDIEIIEELRNINLLETTPIDALNILYRLQERVAHLRGAVDEQEN